MSIVLGPEHVGQDIQWPHMRGKKMRGTVVSRPFTWRGQRLIVIHTEDALRPVCMDATNLEAKAEVAPPDEEADGG